MNISSARRNMIQRLIQPSTGSTPEALEAIRTTPRELFVPDNFKKLAYAELNITVDEHQTMLQPDLQAALLSAAEIKKTHHVLVVNLTTGYLSALIAKLAQSVISIGINEKRLITAEQHFAALDLHNIKTVHTDTKPYKFLNDAFDKIILCGAMNSHPKISPDLLKNGGNLVGFFGSAPCQKLQVLSVDSNRNWHKRTLKETQVTPIHSKLLSLLV